MATFSNMISVFFLVFFVGIASSTPTVNDVQTMLTQSINHFAKDVFEVVSKEYAGQNFAISPVSTNILLALLSLTAKGETQKELIDGLYQPSSGFTSADYKSTVNEMKSEDGAKLALKVYINTDLNAESTQMDPTFNKNAADFGVEAQFINFTKQNETAAEMNAWVANKTNNGIKDLVDPADLHKDSFVVLIDALSFKGDFEQQFNPNFTSNDPFYPDNSSTIELPTMHEFMQNLPYAETSKEQILWLPIKGGYYLILNLPKGEHSMEDEFTDYSGFTKPASVVAYVALPKFYIETTIEDKTVLTKLGMGTMFTDKAELGVLANPQSKGGVTKSMKKTAINVDEKGVSAAITTGQVAENKSPTQKSHAVAFIANKPFYYTLVDDDLKTFISGKFTGKN